MTIDFKELLHGHLVISTAHDYYFINFIPILVIVLILALLLVVAVAIRDWLNKQNPN